VRPFDVHFTMFARDSYTRLVNEVNTHSSAPGSATAFDRLLLVNETVDQLKALDPSLDIILEGNFWWACVYTNGEMQFFYNRTPRARQIVVYHFGEIGRGSTSAYAIFAQLVLSGRFNSVMERYGITMPRFIPDCASLSFH